MNALTLMEKENFNMPKFDRKRAKEELLKRQQESYDRKDGEIGTKYFKTDIAIPFWKCPVTKDEPHIIDIIPFVAGGHYPQIGKTPTKKGDPTYLLEAWVHTNIGPGKEMILCPAKNYGRPCPICEEVDRLADEGKEWEDYSSIAPKRRCVYNVVVMDGGKEEKKGVQIWEVSHKYSEKLIQPAAKAPRGGGLIPFSDPDIGKSIAFEVLNDTYRTIQGHKLVDRDYNISDEVLDAAFTLDELLLELPYEEIDKIFSGNVEKETSGSEQGSRTRGKQEVDECPHVDDAWGKMIDKLEECEKCELYDKCGREADKLEAEEKAKKEEERKKAEAEKQESGGEVRRRRRV